jgi:hypothetical protein
VKARKARKRKGVFFMANFFKEIKLIHQVKTPFNSKPIYYTTCRFYEMKCRLTDISSPETCHDHMGLTP